MTTKELRRERLLEELPRHGWSVPKAGEAAGYRKLYAQKRLPDIIRGDVEFCGRILAKRQAIEATTTDKREKALRKLDDIINDASTQKRDAIRAIEVMGKMCGWLSETRVLELPERQRQLSASEQEEARRIALLRFDTRGSSALPAEIIDAGGLV